MAAVLELKDLSYVYGQGTPFCKTAVDHVSLSIEEGKFIGVIGHTGSGKSTLIQQFNGLLRPTSGHGAAERPGYLGTAEKDPGCPVSGRHGVSVSGTSAF